MKRKSGGSAQARRMAMLGRKANAAWRKHKKVKDAAARAWAVANKAEWALRDSYTAGKEARLSRLQKKAQRLDGDVISTWRAYVAIRKRLK